MLGSIEYRKGLFKYFVECPFLSTGNPQNFIFYIKSWFGNMNWFTKIMNASGKKGCKKEKNSGWRTVQVF